MLRYTFESNDDAGPFLINHTTGEITTVSSLDWETQSSYSIQVSDYTKEADCLWWYRGGQILLWCLAGECSVEVIIWEGQWQLRQVRQ